ncbi:MAG: TrbI/VirB10 family protein [Alphaproteobacteria bacterium]|nr:TrbI/VirB10 family protein [Alphaproteobacteria bacterium]MBL7097278.1 TrbI/VirB10 family protein [Alphaproteobacteria bacterium]
MSEPHEDHAFTVEAEVPDAPRARPSEMRLRSDRPPVTRLSRRVLLGLGSVAAIGVAAALFFALRQHDGGGTSELYNTSNRSTPEGLSVLPRDYSGLPRAVPRLGPPLPGDLGKPMLNAGVAPPGMPSASTLTPEQQRELQEQEAARTSHLFTAASPTQSAGPATPVTSSAAPTAPATGTIENGDHKLAFLNQPPDRQTQSLERLADSPNPNMLLAGTVIPAALITGLRSDLPGQVTAQVTQDCYDSPTGTILLIPQGSKILGQYDAQISFGQSRALVVWNRLILPNGKSIVLQRQPGTDTEGYAGLEDEVDNHWGTLFEAAALSTILSVGSEAGTSDSENSLVQAIRQGASQSFNQAGEQVVGRSLNVQPTINIRPGFPVNVLVTRDLILEPYRN